MEDMISEIGRSITSEEAENFIIDIYELHQISMIL